VAWTEFLNAALVANSRPWQQPLLVPKNRETTEVIFGATSWLLRARCERPRHRRAAEQRHELAPLHSITSSAMASTPGGIVRPSILAVGALMTSSNLVDCWTGNSAGFAPLRMRPV
jgi:hypothetical protein